MRIMPWVSFKAKEVHRPTLDLPPSLDRELKDLLRYPLADWPKRGLEFFEQFHHKEIAAKAYLIEHYRELSPVVTIRLVEKGSEPLVANSKTIETPTVHAPAEPVDSDFDPEEEGSVQADEEPGNEG